MNIKAKFQRWCLYHVNFHIVRVEDIALGESDGCSVPLTGWRWRCLLCGKSFDEIENAGLQQIASGIPVERAIQWMFPERDEKEKPLV